MPYYDFKCNDCGSITEAKLSFDEIDRGVKPVCSKCKGQNLVRLISGFSVSGSSKGKSSSCSCNSCSSGSCSNCGNH